MADNTYQLKLSGDEINNRLQLIQGDSTTVKIAATNITNSKGAALATIESGTEKTLADRNYELSAGTLYFVVD